MSDSSVWKLEAAQLPVKRLGPVGQLLKRHIQQNNPRLLQELQATNDLLPFLLVQQETFKDHLADAVEQGTDPNLAREHALADLLASCNPPEPRRPEEDEQEEENAEAIVGAWLASQDTPDPTDLPDLSASRPATSICASQTDPAKAVGSIPSPRRNSLMKLSKKTALRILWIVLAVLFAVFVWPTPYKRTGPLVNRFTGERVHPRPGIPNHIPNYIPNRF